MMRLLKQAVTVVGTLAILVAILVVVAPNKAHALAAIATLVRDVDNPARDTFQAVFQTPCNGSLGAIDCSGLTVPSVNGAGQTVSMLVIEYISGNCPGSSGAGSAIITNYSNAQLDSMIGFGGIVNTTSTSGYFLQNVFTPNQEVGFAQQTRLYAAPGSRITGIAYSNCTLSISGYFVTP